MCPKLDTANVPKLGQNVKIYLLIKSAKIIFLQLRQLLLLHPSWDYSVPSFRESTVCTIPVSCIIFDEINHTKGILWERIIQRI